MVQYGSMMGDGTDRQWIDASHRAATLTASHVIITPSELLSLKQLVIYDDCEKEFLSLILPQSKTPVMRNVVQGDECDPPPGWDAR
jgi:hypothetical protein